MIRQKFLSVHSKHEMKPKFLCFKRIKFHSGKDTLKLNLALKNKFKFDFFPSSLDELVFRFPNEIKPIKLLFMLDISWELGNKYKSYSKFCLFATEFSSREEWDVPQVDLTDSEKFN